MNDSFSSHTRRFKHCERCGTKLFSLHGSLDLWHYARLRRLWNNGSVRPLFVVRSEFY